MVLNGIELEFDFYDADQMEIFEDALDKATEAIEGFTGKPARQSQMIRSICEVTINMLDDVFGEGTSNDVFKGETNFKKCLEVFTVLVKERAKQEEEIAQEINVMKDLIETEKEQQPNRAARRIARKN